MGVRCAGLILQRGRLGRHPWREDLMCAVCSLTLSSQQKKKKISAFLVNHANEGCVGVELMSRSIKTQSRQGPVVLSMPQSSP